MKEYRVLTQKEKWFGTKLDPEALEKDLNAYAQEGWRVVSCATASRSNQDDEIIVLLEREV